MDDVSLGSVLAMTNCRCRVLAVHPGHVEMVNEEIVIKMANVLWVKSLDDGILRLEMINGLLMDIQPLSPIL